ncbi:MAG: 30S ribosomal protein S20 [Bacteroidota bacterium]
MANHLSAQKRIRVTATKRLRNRYQLKTCRTAMKRLQQTKDRQAAALLLQSVSTMLDKLARKYVIHKNKAARNKATLAKYCNKLQMSAH